MSDVVYTGPVHWGLRRLIRTGSHPGVAGIFGRWLGRVWGAPIPGGLHFVVTSPGEAIQSLMLFNGLYEPTTCGLIADLVRDGRRVVYDVGANAGQHTLVAIAAGARVVAFEPVARLAEHLRANLRRNRMSSRAIIVGTAVSDRVGNVPFHVATRFDDGSHSLVAGIEASRIDTIQVPTTSLDVFVRDHPRMMPSLVKVDVEGAEALVLDGARSLLEGPDRPDWIIETSDNLSRSLGESAEKVLARLRSRGYRLLRIQEWPPALREVTASTNVAPLGNYLALGAGRPFGGLRTTRLRTANGWVG